MKRIQNKIGLTIVEILVVVAIISLLAAGLYTVGNYVETQTKIKQTKSTIEILSAALEQYYDFYNGVRGVGKFPDPNDPNGVPLGCNSNMEKLYYRLSCVPDAKKILNQINPTFIKDVDDNNRPEIIDAWGNHFHYSYVPSRNFPVIDSNGPDKKLGGNDDISSR